jgi:hypothetical protein
MRGKSIELVAAALLVAAVAPAAAGDCCFGCGCGPAPYVDVGSEMLLVEQGPIVSGPGPFVVQGPDVQPPAFFPYVGFVFSGWPYGYYSPWVGAPYPGLARGWGPRARITHRAGWRRGYYHAAPGVVRIYR